MGCGVQADDSFGETRCFVRVESGRSDAAEGEVALAKRRPRRIWAIARCLLEHPGLRTPARGRLRGAFVKECLGRVP